MKMPGRSFVIEIAKVELQERLQRLAVAAADLIAPGMVVGLGTGSTADAVTRELGRRVAGGLNFTAVPTSDRTEELARSLGIPLATLEEIDRLDIGIDGADEIDPALDAIKGRGGALLREKLVALSCDDYVLVATTEKSVDQLGARTPLPIEIVAFGWSQTATRLANMGISPEPRTVDGDPARPWVTDNGGVILDCATGPIADPHQLAAAVKAVSGVVAHGLFLGIARTAFQVDPDGQVVRRDRTARQPGNRQGWGDVS
jgi:ribose 5-phosphate isomerase A